MRVASFKTVLPLAILLVLALPPAPAGAGVLDLDDWKTNASGWSDFGVGTTLHYRTERERRVQGMEAPVRSILESERKLLRLDDARFVFQVRVKAATAWTAPREDTMARAGKDTYTVTQETVTVTEPQKVTVEDTVYRCKKIRFVRMRDGVQDDQIVAWINDKHGVLKTEQEIGPGTMVTQTVTKLEAERTVGGIKLRCRELSIEAPGTKGTLVLSGDVPGRIVSEQITIKREQQTSTLKRELIGFVKK